MAHKFDGESFKAAVIAAGYRDEELAVDAGCSKSLIKLYKYGYRTPPPPRLITLAALLDVHVEDFFTEVDEGPGVRAVDTRRIVGELGLDDSVAKIVVHAPPLTDAQLDALRLIFRSTNESRPKKPGLVASTTTAASGTATKRKMRRG